MLLKLPKDLGDDSFFDKYCWENWAFTYAGTKDEPCLSACAKISFKWVKDITFPKPEI